ncbi:MAG: 4-hydroxy-tetrahydrodipicolinate reductase [Defluviitaleaceae bacterium]|nr:4-hydroxy-tetrahydrodipicolinate reductase [Defluviitaleaceae bacterium]
MTKIILNGCMGKLSNAISNLAQYDKHCEIVGGIDIVGSGSGLAFPTYSDLDNCDLDADVIVDCSVVETIPSLLNFGIKRQMPLVICTTGLSKEQIEDVYDASKKVAILQSANMSLGINLLVNMVQQAAKLLHDSNFNIEIIEKHHNQKVDAPSGTALLLADTINQSLDNQMDYVYDRSTMRNKRGVNEIGFHALRGGTIVGEHSVVFAGTDEVIEFSHQALSKEVFAVGALKAACFMKGKAPGFYTMQDVILAKQ